MLKKNPCTKDLLFLLYIAAPETDQDLKDFIINIFSDKQAIDFKIPLFFQKTLAKIIANIRIKKISKIYNEVFGGASPQVKILKNLTEKLALLYKDHTGRQLFIKSGMCYTKPFIENAVNEVRLEEFENIFVLTLYPHYSFTTAGVCINRFITKFKDNPFSDKLNIFYYWYNNKKFNDLWVKNIKETARENNVCLDESTLIFSAHSLPVSTLRKSDLYTTHLRKHTSYLAKILNPKAHYLAYQSKASFGSWLAPDIFNIIEEVAVKNLNNVIFVPITFVNDHIETLYEIDKIYIKEFQKRGINAIRVKCFSDVTEFAGILIDIVTTNEKIIF